MREFLLFETHYEKSGIHRYCHKGTLEQLVSNFGIDTPIPNIDSLCHHLCKIRGGVWNFITKAGMSSLGVVNK